MDDPIKIDTKQIPKELIDWYTKEVESNTSDMVVSVAFGGRIHQDDLSNKGK